MSDKPAVEAIDPKKLAKRDNEILRELDSETHSIGVRNPQQGFRYARLTRADGLGSGAQANVRTMHATAKRFGYEIVQGEDPEDESFKGTDGGTTRTIGDTVLYRISEEHYAAMQREVSRRRADLEAEEERWASVANRYAPAFGAAGNFGKENPLGRAWGTAGQPLPHVTGRAEVQATNFTEGDLRRGSIKDSHGNVIQPGFDKQPGVHTR